MLNQTDSLDIQTLGGRLRAGSLQPREVVAGVLERIAAYRDRNPAVWIHLLPRDALEARAADLEKRGPQGLPLYGIPFAIKDNIDLAGHPTTAACPDYRYVARESATVVQRLIDAGAIALGAKLMACDCGKPYSPNPSICW